MKKPILLATVISLMSLGGALSLEAASPAPQASSLTAASATPAKAVHSKKKVHHANHMKAHRTKAHAPNPA
jgi:hypothetical protein